MTGCIIHRSIVWICLLVFRNNITSSSGVAAASNSEAGAPPRLRTTGNSKRFARTRTTTAAREELPSLSLSSSPPSPRMPPASSISRDQIRMLDETATATATATTAPRIVSNRALGEKELLVIRIDVVNGVSTTASEETLADAIFSKTNNNNNSLAKQFAACSRNQFVLKPATTGNNNNNNNIRNGIATIKLGVGAVVGRTAQSIYEEIERISSTTKDNDWGRWYFGRPLEDFDQVMICMPPGVVVVASATNPNNQNHDNTNSNSNHQTTDDDWIAFVPSEVPYRNYLSVYNDEWCTSVSSGMHEIGHTLGLQHAGESNSYDDETGQMGFTSSSSSSNNNNNRSDLKCFNPAKSWQLGWYADRSLRFDPLLDPMPASMVLQGITSDNNEILNDKSKTKIESYVLLQIPNGPEDGNFYIGYNHKDGFNAGTDEGYDMVLVNLQAAGGLKESRLLAKLDFNESYRIHNYRGILGKTLVIERKGRISSMEGALVDIYFEKHNTANNANTNNNNEQQQLQDGCAADPTNQTVRFEVSVVTDWYPEDTSWTLRNDQTGEIVAGRKTGSFREPESSSVDWVCLDCDDGLNNACTYTFVLLDLYKDGMCCDYGAGGYSGFLGGKEIFRGGEFDNMESVHHTFVVPPSIVVTATTDTPSGECEDDSAYRFKQLTGRDCEWVGRHESRRTQKCNQNDPKTTLPVQQYCPSVCLAACRNKKHRNSKITKPKQRKKTKTKQHEQKR